MSRLNVCRASVVCFFVFLSGQAQAQSHASIDQTRSAMSKNIFITQGVEGEYGRFEKVDKDGLKTSESWKGFGIRNGFGKEVFKFIAFSLSHTLLNLRSNESSLESLQGSRLSAEIALQFSAPVTNIQFGLGLNGQQMAYQNYDKSSTMSGLGRYYMVGLNYFVSPSISLQAQGKRVESISKASGGSSLVNRIESKTDNFSLGLSVWL